MTLQELSQSHRETLRALAVSQFSPKGKQKKNRTWICLSFKELYFLEAGKQGEFH